MKHFVAIVCLVCALMVSKSTLAQNYLYATGNPTFSSQIPVENGFINVNNGEVHIEIPLSTHSQRGSLRLNERLIYDSRIWKIAYNSGYKWQPTNVPNSMGGWVFSSGTATGTYSYSTLGGQVWCYPSNPSMGYYNYTQYVDFMWTDPQGTSHSFYYPTVQYSSPSNPPCNAMPQSQPSAGGWASDGSGYYIQLTNYTNVVIYDRQGNIYHPTYVGTNPPANSPLIVDPNGNYFSQDASGNLIDTLGRTPVLTSTSGNHIYYDVLGYGGIRSRYTVTTETINFNTAFSQSGVTETSGSFTAIQSLQLPDGSSYSFTYDSGTAAGNYGELTSITLPTGAIIQYTYQNFLDSFQNQNRWLLTRVKDGGTTRFTPATISNCTSSSGCQEKVTVTSPASNDTVYTFTLDKSALANAGSWATTIDAWQGAAGTGTKLISQSTSYSYVQYQEIKFIDSNNTITNNYIYYQAPSAVITTTALSDVTLTKKVETDLVALGAYPSAYKAWDYYSGTAPSSPTLETDYTYNYAVNFAQFPTQIVVKDGAGNHVSETDYGYDETTGTGHAALQPTSGLTQHNSVSGNRGNVTTIAQWIGSSGATLSKEGTYDDAGTVLTSMDPNGVTSYGHDATDAFTTSTTLPTPSSGIALIYSGTVDYSTGLSTGQTDPNGTQNTPQGYDAFGRPTGFVVSNAGTTYAKSSFNNTSTQSSDYEYQNASVYADAETLYDGYGRVSRVANANGQASNPWYQVDSCYDTSGRVNFQSYPYQANGFASPKICSGSGDTYGYDALSRIKTIGHSDGTTIQYNYTGRATKMTDENGVTRISQTDGLGRTTIVCEISSNSSMPGSGSPVNCGTDIAGTGFTTTYAYDLVNHKTTMTQGTQMRIFQTDWADRPVFAQEPESGQTTYSYAYNSTGLVVTRHRPKANQPNPAVLATTTTQYDSLGRLITVNYDDGTDTKNFLYDKSIGWSNFSQTNLKGRLAGTAMTASGAATGSSYDAVGRVTGMQQCIASACGSGGYNLTYTYDWTGNLKTSTDGAGVTSTYTVSPASELLSLTSSLNNSTNPPNIVSNVQNGPHGPTSYALGNGLSAVLSYDALGRNSGGWICNGSTSPYCTGGTQVYGFTTGWTGIRNTTECDTVLSQCMNFGYDEFNRLTSRTVTSGTAQNFSYVYDRYGNRWQQNVTAGSGPSPQLSFDTSTNKLTGSGYAYDAAGNMTNDSFHAYSYDAEGNIVAVDPGTTAVAYNTYDALNHLVQNVIPQYSFAGQTVFNKDGYRVSYPGSNDGVYFWGAKRVGFYYNGQVTFQHQDWLGTERMRTTYNGGLAGAFTSLPFGDAWTTVSGHNYDAYHFAGMDEDTASSGLDFLGQYREYNPTQGRWLSPDPYSGSYDFTNPQSLNRYAYVSNNPLSLTDPSGLVANGNTTGDGGGGCDLTCAILTVGIGALIGELEDLFGGRPSFHGSLHPRPNSTGDPNWDGNFGERLGISTKVPRMNLGIAEALGLPDAGCEFGACGAGASNFSPGSIGASFSKITIDPRLLYIADALNWAFTGKHSKPSPAIHGNWCGPGGAGFPVDAHDSNCMFHDYCYQANNLSASDNLFIQPPGKRALLHGCNQALCNAESKLGGRIATEINGYFSIIPSADNGCTQ